MRLVCIESSKVKMCELGSVSESKRVQRLHRPSINFRACWTGVHCSSTESNFRVCRTTVRVKLQCVSNYSAFLPVFLFTLSVKYRKTIKATYIFDIRETLFLDVMSIRTLELYYIYSFYIILNKYDYESRDINTIYFKAALPTPEILIYKIGVFTELLFKKTLISIAVILMKE